MANLISVGWGQSQHQHDVTYFDRVTYFDLMLRGPYSNQSNKPRNRFLLLLWIIFFSLILFYIY